MDTSKYHAKTMHRIIFGLAIACLLPTAFACQNKQKKEATTIVEEWLGKEIRFPVMLGDTAQRLDSLLAKEYKILFYTDSAGCTMCNMNLGVWASLIEEADTLFPSNRLSFLFFVQPKNEEFLQNLVDMEQFEYPLFADYANRIDSLNRFPKQENYRCFLLDKENKVRMIGNPANKPSIWTLYKEFLTQ
jgi:hypothetical protein